MYGSKENKNSIKPAKKKKSNKISESNPLDLSTYIFTYLFV